MTSKSKWEKANRELIAEQRRKLGDPPTAEEMLAYCRGEMTEAEEDRIRDLLVAYPEVARIYGTKFPEAPRPGDPDEVSPERINAGWGALQKRLGGPGVAARSGMESQRGLFHYAPTALAASLVIVFFGLFVNAERRARYEAREAARPRMLAAPQELTPDVSRGPGAATMLRKDGEAYLLKPKLIQQLRHPHYRIELHDARGEVIWTNNTAQPDEEQTFQIVVPHAFFRAGEIYRLHIFGVDGENRTAVGSYDLTVPSE